ncbi:translocation/assembly module TamB domain-containing protein [Thiolapillus sp.]
MKTWLKRVLLALFLLVVLVVGAAAILLGTTPGVRWLVDMGNRFVPGELAVGQTQGNLLGELQLQDVSYANQDMSVQVGDVVLSWAPSELFSGVFHLRDFSVDKLRYEKLRETPEEPSGPLELPDISLPLQLQLDRVQASALEIISAPGADPLVIDQVQLAAGWQASGIDLSRMQLAMPDLKFKGKGKVDPKGDYPLDLTMDWQFSGEGLPRVSGKGNLKGDMQKLQLQQRLDGDVKAALSANVHDVLRELGWNTKIQVSKLPQAYLPLDEPAQLGIDVQGKGDLSQADVTLAFRVQEGKKQTAEKARQVLLNLVASIRFADQKFSLQGDWTDFQWPLTGTPQVLAKSGKLQASGIPDGYEFKLQSDLEGGDIPPGSWQAQGKGGLSSLRLEKMLGNILDGSLEAAGDLAWSPKLTWKMDITTTDIDPGTLNREWPGKLNASLATSGELPESGLQLQAKIRDLSGTLRDRPVAGGGDIRIDGNKLLLDNLEFSSGSARVNATGELGDAWNLTWMLDVPDVADLLPGGEGQIQASGDLKGTQQQPIVEGRLKVAALSAMGYRCAQCDADFAVGLEETFVSRVLFTGKDVFAAGQAIPALTLKLDGPLKQHVVDLSMEHEMGKLAFTAAGAYLMDKAAWQGQVQKLDLNAGEIGDWKLKEGADLLASAEEIKLSPLCLRDQQSSLCVQVDRGKDKGNARLKLQGLSLSRLQPWLPPEITRLTGVLHMDATADLEPVIKARAELVLEPGEITYLNPQSKPITMKLHDGKVDAVYDEKQLSAQWELGLDQNRMSGDLFVPREALDKDPLTAPLKGKVKMQVTDLNLVTAFVPDIQKIDGQIDVALNLGGQLGDPLITGHAIVESKEIIIPRAGLELQDLQVQIKGEGGKKLDISGSVTSGQGTLDLSGSVLLDAQQGWPARLALKGDHFQLANLPEAEVIVTPDIKLESTGDLVKIRGTLDVPVAKIELNDLPAGSRDVSPDVVVVSEDGSVDEVANSRIDAEIAITLGDEVHFKGFGLDADLAGKLSIDQNPGKYPTASGELKIEGGYFRAYGQNLTIEKGRISYAGGRVDNPGLRLRASRKIDDTTVGVELTGTAKKPEFSTFSSDPDLLEKDVVSMLLTGQKSGDLANAKVYAGKQITEDLSVGVNLGGGKDGSEFVTRYRLMDNVNLEATSSAKKSGGSINYTIELE